MHCKYKYNTMNYNDNCYDKLYIEIDILVLGGSLRIMYTVNYIFHVIV